jgi:hypothetical protein
MYHELLKQFQSLPDRIVPVIERRSQKSAHLASRPQKRNLISRRSFALLSDPQRTQAD